MTISYAITVCDEFEEIQRLITILLLYKRPEDEVVVLYDNSKQSQGVEEYLRSHSTNGEFMWHSATFDGHFDAWKNKLNSLCSKDFIFQIDADETPDRTMIENLPALLKEQFGRIDLLLVPRINTVKGLSDEHIQKWRWKIDKHFGFECVNFPDFQTRIYRNDPSIKWHGKVHERITGVDKYAYLPTNVVDWCLYHHKTIERQQKQNDYYSNL